MISIFQIFIMYQVVLNNLDNNLFKKGQRVLKIVSRLNKAFIDSGEHFKSLSPIFLNNEK